MKTSSPSRPLIVLSLEGLARAALSCYGCSWNRTPAIDSIAGGGVVWDRVTAESDDPSEVLQAWLNSDWAEPWQQVGSVELVTDTAEPASSCFDHVTRVPSAAPPEHPAEDIVETQLGRVIAAAIDRDQNFDDWSVLWIHSDALTRCWDAPRHLFPDEQLDDDDDLEPPEEGESFDADTPQDPLPPPLQRIFDCTSPPQYQRREDDHPDWISSWMRTYACQIRLVDLLIEVLLESLQVQDPWFVLAGTSGYRLGQAGWIGSRGGTLRSADIHLPLILSDLGPLRIPRLTASGVVTDLLSMLSQERPQILPVQLETELDSKTQVETSSKHVLRAITTPQWYYVQELDQRESLFLKPDDVEDCNDVARVRKEVVNDFRRSD
ncbi:MAG: hypothetical protein P8L85_21095 [Rubripirellula sp.]|nr:hypothetical protein [Rubripirellula sp.]